MLGAGGGFGRLAPGKVTGGEAVFDKLLAERREERFRSGSGAAESRRADQIWQGPIPCISA